MDDPGDRRRHPFRQRRERGLPKRPLLRIVPPPAGSVQAKLSPPVERPAPSSEARPTLFHLRRLIPHRHRLRAWQESGLGSQTRFCLWCGKLMTAGAWDGTYLTYREWLALIAKAA